MRASRYLLLLVSLYLALCGSASAQRRGGSSSHSKTHSSSSKSSAAKTVHVRSYTKKDGTVVKSYDRRPPGSKDSGSDAEVRSSTATAALRDSNGRIKRSAAAKEAFERQTGYPHGRPGYVVDHIKPLACGGSDSPDNMQWQTVAEAKAKDKTERIGCK